MELLPVPQSIFLWWPPSEPGSLAPCPPTTPSAWTSNHHTPWWWLESFSSRTTSKTCSCPLGHDAGGRGGPSADVVRRGSRGSRRGRWGCGGGVVATVISDQAQFCLKCERANFPRGFLSLSALGEVPGAAARQGSSLKRAAAIQTNQNRKEQKKSEREIKRKEAGASFTATPVSWQRLRLLFFYAPRRQRR